LRASRRKFFFINESMRALLLGIAARGKKPLRCLAKDDSSYGQCIAQCNLDRSQKSFGRRISKGRAFDGQKPPSRGIPILQDFPHF